MNSRSLSIVALLLTAGARFAIAGDEPHWITYGTQCNSCHAGHKAAGSSLTNVAGNANLCQSCHNLAGAASAFPMERMVIADPVNGTGSSHAWNVIVTNPNTGASTPTNAQMSIRLDAGKVVCSVCHNQHLNDTSAITAGTAGTQQRSAVVKLAGAGTGTLAYTAAAAAGSRSYVIEVVEVAGATGTARFRLSNDGGSSWFGWSGSAWVAYTTGNARLTSASVTLNDGANVVAQFSGTFAIGDKFRFYVSYPFLRAPTDTGSNTAGNKLCRDCHSAWVMDHNGARTWDGSFRSHPVGVGLNANGGGYDRATPLDGNGAVQGSGGVDSNSTNDLRLAADSTVQCLTCHGVHHADGNTTTIDVP